MNKICNLFAYLTIILFVQFISWTGVVLIWFFATLEDVPLWADFIIILLGSVTILSAGITMLLYEKPSRTKEHTEIIKEPDYCSVCDSFLHNNDNYQDDFPKKYKICCNCKDIADIVYKENHEEIYNRIIELKNLIPSTDAEVYLDWSERYLQNKKRFDDIFIFKNKKKNGNDEKY